MIYISLYDEFPKRVLLYLPLIIIAVFFSCTKIEREPKVETGEINDITTTNASAAGNIIDLGVDGIIDYGHCWSTTTYPSINNFKTSFGRIARTGSYTSILQSLQPGTKYYIKAYAKNANDKVYYGGESSFTTYAISLPTITTTPVTSITSTTAISGGNVTSDGGAEVTARGVCWSTNSNPTVTLISKTTNGAGTGSFTSNITGLTGNTTYHVRAYATNSAGTAYGNNLTFATPPQITLPTVTTGTTTATSSTTATSGGNVTSDGGATVTVRGVCWSTSPNPTTSNSKTSNGSGTGIFTSSITGLSGNTTYHVRAYATNSAGTSYGNQISVTTDPITISDVDGNIYNVIRIRTQLWMKENLKTTKFNDGTDIPMVTDNIAWSNLTSPGYCWYDNDAALYKELYGALYNAYTINTNKLCPLGWHVPNRESDIETLVEFLGGGYVAGGKLKESGTIHWLSPNTGATNESKFTALPGGQRAGTFQSIGRTGIWWLSSPDGYFIQLHYDSNYFSEGNLGSIKYPGNSIRCIKD